MMIRLLIADDHTLFREGLKRTLRETKDIIVTDEAVNGQEVLQKVNDKQFDVILLDISMPGRNGLEVLKQLKHDRPDVRVLVLTMHAEEEYAERVFRAGAFGYLTKENTPSELISAIRKVVQGKKYVSPSLAEKLAWKLETTTNMLPHEALSDREYQIMCMVASGRTVKEIAEELSLSVKTISTHRMHILQKMDVKSNAQLTHYAFQNNLID